MNENEHEREDVSRTRSFLDLYEHENITENESTTTKKVAPLQVCSVHGVKQLSNDKIITEHRVLHDLCGRLCVKLELEHIIFQNHFSKQGDFRSH